MNDEWQFGFAVFAVKKADFFLVFWCFFKFEWIYDNDIYDNNNISNFFF